MTPGEFVAWVADNSARAAGVEVDADAALREFRVLPPWPGPLTRDSTWADVEARLDHHIAERRERARRRRGDTQTAADRGGDEERTSDAGEQE